MFVGRLGQRNDRRGGRRCGRQIHRAVIRLGGAPHKQINRPAGLAPQHSLGDIVLPFSLAVSDAAEQQRQP